MNKTASRFLQRSRITPSAVGLGPSLRGMRVRVGGPIPKLESYMRAAGCTDAAIHRFRELVHQGRRVGIAVSVAIRETMPALYRDIRRVPDVQPNWTFRKLLKEYAKRRPKKTPLRPQRDGSMRPSGVR